MPEKKIKIWLDSGAYSVWNRGETIDLTGYIDFIHRNKHNLEYYVNLDVIPGVKLRESTPQEVEDSARKGFENMLRMRKEGLDPMPVYHYGEKREWLEKMVDLGCSYIGLALGRQGADPNARKWLDAIFQYLCHTPTGFPTVKLHGFGLTVVPFLLRYPWFSVDSTTWIFAAAYGRCLFPRIAASGDFDFSVAPLYVGFTDRDSSPMLEKHNYYDSVGDTMKKFIARYIEFSGLAITPDSLKTNYYDRLRINAFYFKQVGVRNILRPYDVPVVSGFFDKQVFKTLPAAVLPEHLQMVNAVGLNAAFNEILNDVDSNNRLISYADMGKNDTETIERLVTTGKVREDKDGTK